MNCRLYTHVLLAVILLGVQEIVCGQVEYYYHELPPLHTFDDYDLCFQKGNTKLASTYCMVYAEVKPENSSELWQKITSHKNKSIFNLHRDRLFFGMCMERCIKFAQTADNKSFINDDDDDRLNNDITQHFELVHKRPLDIEMRSKYAAMIQNCLNDDFEAKYHLKLRTFVEYCETKPEYSSVEKDPAESLLYTILQTIGLLTILSSLYDYCLKCHQPEVNQTNDFYKYNLGQPISRILTSFSICRNYYRITQPYRGEIGKDFRYLDGFRSMTTLMVMHSHMMVLQYLHLKNPEYFEELFATPIGLWLLNTNIGIEIFMVMSGLLVSINFSEGRFVTRQTTWKECVKVYMQMIFNRLMRFVPSIALLLLVNATVFSRIADGPFWRHAIEPSRVFSRENWWKNLLMFNNMSLKETITQHFELVHKRPLDIEMRSKYAAMIQNCLNDDFEAKYHLKLRTFVEYCETKPEYSSVEKDPAESLLYTILQTIGLLTILSSLYDYCLKCHQPEVNQTNDFYKYNLGQPISRILTSFSICRNYYRITQPYRGEIGKDFRYLDGFRSMTTLMVMHSHMMVLQYLHLKNPEYFEELFATPIGLWLLNTNIGIEIFMVMSGLLVSINFSEGRFVTRQTTWKECVKVYMQMIFNRLMRFVPSIALLLLVNATVFSRIADGPFWRHAIEPSRVFSRENWWKNLLMFNNMSLKETALIHTWFIATYFQLSAFYLLILIFTAKYPQYKKRMFTTLAILAVAIPTLISYVLKSEATYLITGEWYRYMFPKDYSINFYNLYTPFYTNLGGYLFGIICGELYLKYLRFEETRKKVRGVFKLEYACYISIPVAVLIIYVGAVMFFKEPSLWTALCSGLIRNLWIVFVCGNPLLSMACQAGKMAYDFCCLPVFRVLARISFQIYLWHIQIIFITNACVRAPYNMTTLHYFGQGMITATFSMIVAFFVCLLVELPIGQCLDLIKPKRNQTIDSQISPEHTTKQTKVQ